jgi:5-methylcytosine-specific restriction enzyme subunit McrC
MIQRTVSEWKGLRYGAADNQIPLWAADRLAKVARGLPLGGADGSRIITQGRTELRAGQIVGMLVARDCALEILPKIDGVDEPGAIRRRLVHMLAAVLNIGIDAGEVTQLGLQRDNILEILIRLFAGRLGDALREGMPRRYIAEEGDLPTLRGRLDAGQQFTRLVMSPQTLACRFDTLSPDIPLNQVMKAAVARLARLTRSEDTQRRLRELTFTYAEIPAVPLPALRWDDIVLDRTNSKWKHLVDLARLFLGNRFQTTSFGADGGYSLLFDMAGLFEEYVARLLSKALRPQGLRVVSQGGLRHCLEDMVSGGRSFVTKPDILVKDGGETVAVVDTKWKRLSAAVDDPKKGVSQGDLYQMMAYGQVYSCPRLMLLYPHHGELEAEGILGQHRVTATNHTLTIASFDIGREAGGQARLRDLITAIL